MDKVPLGNGNHVKETTQKPRKQQRESRGCGKPLKKVRVPFCKRKHVNTYLPLLKGVLQELSALRAGP